MSSGRRRDAALLLLVAVAALLFAWAAAIGPTGVVGDATGSGGVVGARGSERQAATPERGAQGEADASDRPLGSGRRPAFDLLLAAAIIVTLLLAGGAVRAALLRRQHAPPDRPLLPPPPAEEGLREQLARRRVEQEAALAQGPVTDGIVACWVAFESAATQAGWAPGPAETSTEFVTRLLAHLDVGRRPVAALTALYQEARFSSHDLPAEARSRAGAALADIHADLTRRRASTGAGTP